MLLLLFYMAYLTVILRIAWVIYDMLTKHMVCIITIFIELWTIGANSTLNLFYFTLRFILELAKRIRDVMLRTFWLITKILWLRTYFWHRYLILNVLLKILLKQVSIVYCHLFILNNVFNCVALR